MRFKQLAVKEAQAIRWLLKRCFKYSWFMEMPHREWKTLGVLKGTTPTKHYQYSTLIITNDDLWMCSDTFRTALKRKDDRPAPPVTLGKGAFYNSLSKGLSCAIRTEAGKMLQIKGPQTTEVRTRVRIRMKNRRTVSEQKRIYFELLSFLYGYSS